MDERGPVVAEQRLGMALELLHAVGEPITSLFADMADAVLRLMMEGKTFGSLSLYFGFCAV